MVKAVPWVLCLLAILAILVGPGAVASPPHSGHGTPAHELCPALLPSSGPAVNVSTVNELQQAVNTAIANTTIQITDGLYALDGVYLRIDVPGVTLRSASGNRESVILDGNYQTTEIIQVVASDVTIADLTLREARGHPIHVMSTGSSATLNTLIYNVHIVDPGQQAIKINPVPGGYYTDGGEIACSHIELTDAGRPKVWEINGSCYTGGIDAHQSRDWLVRDNLIEGFWCEQDLSEHAVHFWRGCRDTVVERNVLLDNARGVGFGLVTSGEARVYSDNPCPGSEGGYMDHYGGMVRNNFVYAGRPSLFASEYGFDCGVCLWQACGARVAHNTVVSTQAPFSSIEWRFDHTDADIVNNLVSHQLRDRGGTARLSGNLEGQPLKLYVDGAGGDLHLHGQSSAAIDAGEAISDGWCDDDIDGDARPIGSARDIGADEYDSSVPRLTVYLPIIIVEE